MEAIGQVERNPTQAAAPRTDRLDITMLMGGPSDERDVSLVSGRAVAAALERAGHRVTARDIGPDDLSALDRKEAEVVFIVLHGAWGESGELQQICEDRGLAYVGSGPAASAAAMDKVAAKQRFVRCGLSTPEWVLLRRGAAPRDGAIDRLGLPCVVKPVDSGSSVDLTVAVDAASRDRAIGEVAARHGQALVERYIRGRELTVGIVGEEALPIVEIIPPGGTYDYHAKYVSNETRYVVNPELPAGAQERLQADGMEAHRALGCRDLSRVDFILDAAGVPWVLEVNTIPGFTSHSLLPKAAAAAGIDFDALCDRLARMAMARAGR